MAVFRGRGGDRRWTDVVCALLLVGGVGWVLAPALLGRGALIDLNLLTLYPPWSAESGRMPSLPCRSDTIDYFSALATVRDGLFSGRLVTWAPYEVGGAPLASLPNHAAFSPFSLPYYVLPMSLAPAWVKLLEVVVAILGTVGFLRLFGVRRVPAAVGGFVFAFCGFLVMWTNWPHTKVAALIPVLFWAVERLLQRRRTVDVVVLSLTFAAMLLGGFPAVTLFTLSVAGPYALVRVWQLRRVAHSGLSGAIRPLVLAAVGLALGAGLAAFQMVPFVANLGALGLEDRDARGANLPGSLLVTTVAPDAYGLCLAGVRYGPMSPIEGTIYLGAAAVVLAVGALLLPAVRAEVRPPVPFMAGMTLVVGFLILVGGPVLLAVQSLPFFGSNGIGRAFSVLAFGVAVLVGVCLDRLMDGPVRTPLRFRHGDAQTDEDAGGEGSRRGRPVRARVLLAVAAGVVAVVLYAIALRSGLSDVPSTADQARLIRMNLIGASLVVLSSTLLVVAAVARPLWVRRLVAVVLVLLVVGQGASFARAAWPLSDPDNYYPVTPTHAFLQENIENERFAAGEGTMLPSTADAYGLRTITGHEFTDPRWWDLLLAMSPDVRLTPTYSSIPRDVSIADMAESPLLDRFAVRYWTAGATTAPGVAERLPATGAGRPIVVTGDEVVRCRVPAGPLRAVEVDLAEPRGFPLARVVSLGATVTTPRGDLRGEVHLSGSRSGALRIPVAGASALTPGAPHEVAIQARGLRGELRLEGGAGGLRCAGVRPPDDGAALAFAGVGATVYERPSALPRIRWAGSAEVISEPGARVGALERGVDDDTVIIEDPELPVGDAAAASVTVVEDAAGRVEVEVDAEGEGYLVVADSIARPGWSVTVDGRPAELVNADHAFGAVVVPEGSHRVLLIYEAPGLAVGTLVSTGSAAFVGILLLGLQIRRRRMSRRSATTSDS